MEPLEYIPTGIQQQIQTTEMPLISRWPETKEKSEIKELFGYNLREAQQQDIIWVKHTLDRDLSRNKNKLSYTGREKVDRKGERYQKEGKEPDPST